MENKDFYIFRHGQSTYNEQGRTQGRTNGSILTKLGEKQARAIGQKLKKLQIEVIVCSPLYRAKQTAELANESLRVKIIEDNRFNEIDVGEAEGMLREDIKAKYPNIFEKWHSNSDECENVCYPGGETKKQARDRILSGLDDWALKNYKTVAVSAHGIMISQIMNMLGKKMDDVPNGAVLHLRWQNKQWKFIELL